MAGIGFSLEMGCLTKEIIDNNKLSNAHISEMGKIVESITNSSETITSSVVTGQIQHAVTISKKILWQSSSKNKIEKSLKLHEISNIIIDNIKCGKLPDPKNGQPDAQEAALKKSTEILSAGVDNKNQLDKEIMETFLQCLSVTVNGLAILKKGSPALKIIQKYIGVEIKSPPQQIQAIEKVTKMLNGLNKLIARFIADEGVNITTYKNNSELTNPAQIFTNDFYNRIFVGSSFSAMTCYGKSMIILHELSHLLGTEDHWYLAGPFDKELDGVSLLDSLFATSRRLFHDFDINHLNREKLEKFILASGKSTIRDAVDKFNSDPFFRMDTALNNADTIALIALELHHASLDIT